MKKVFAILGLVLLVALMGWSLGWTQEPSKGLAILALFLGQNGHFFKVKRSSFSKSNHHTLDLYLHSNFHRLSPFRSLDESP